MSNPTLAEQVMSSMQGNFLADKAQGLDATVQFNLTGEGGGEYYMTIQNGQIGVTPGAAPSPKMTLTADAKDYADIAAGRLNPMAAFSSGKLKVSGDMMFAMKFASLFGRAA